MHPSESFICGTSRYFLFSQPPLLKNRTDEHHMRHKMVQLLSIKFPRCSLTSLNTSKATLLAIMMPLQLYHALVFHNIAVATLVIPPGLNWPMAKGQNHAREAKSCLQRTQVGDACLTLPQNIYKKSRFAQVALLHWLS